MLSCGVTAQLRYESSVAAAGREIFTRNYLQRLSDDIFMWCRESAGRHSRVHFPYGDIRRKTHKQHTTHTRPCTVHRGVSVYCWQLPCVYQPCRVFKPDLSYTLVQLRCRSSAFVPAGHVYFLPTWHTMCAIVCRGGERRGVICVGVVYLCVSSVTMQPHSIAVQVVVTSQLFWIFCKCIVSAFRMSLLDFFNFFFIYYTHFSIETIVINLIITRGNNIRVSNVMNCLDLEFNRDGVF